MGRASMQVFNPKHVSRRSFTKIYTFIVFKTAILNCSRRFFDNLGSFKRLEIKLPLKADAIGRFFVMPRSVTFALRGAVVDELDRIAKPNKSILKPVLLSD